MLNKISGRVLRTFCNQVKRAESNVVEPVKNNEVPVHLRPYDKYKFEVPMEKIKLNSGPFLIN